MSLEPAIWFPTVRTGTDTDTFTEQPNMVQTTPTALLVARIARDLSLPRVGKRIGVAKTVDLQ